MQPRCRRQSTATAAARSATEPADAAGCASPRAPARRSGPCSRAGARACRAARASMRSTARPNASGWRASTATMIERGHRARSRRAAPPAFTVCVDRRVDAGHPGVEEQDERAEEQQHGDEVEQAFEDNGREGRGDRQALAARQQIRPQHFADPRGQHGIGGKADDRGAERDAETRGPDRLQQVDASAARGARRCSAVVTSASASDQGSARDGSRARRRRGSPAGGTSATARW